MSINEVEKKLRDLEPTHLLSENKFSDLSDMYTDRVLALLLSFPGEPLIQLSN